MKALCWMGSGKVEVHNVSDPTILNPHDAIVKITRTAICGSDLHLYDGFIPTMQSGDIVGHEFMGDVVEVGPEVKNLKVGDRVAIGHLACFPARTDPRQRQSGQRARERARRKEPTGSRSSQGSVSAF